MSLSTIYLILSTIYFLCGRSYEAEGKPPYEEIGVEEGQQGSGSRIIYPF